MPSMAPSMAADMVPEYSTLMEVLLPWLMPLTTKSGARSLRTWFFGQLYTIGRGAGAFVGGNIGKNIAWIQPQGTGNGNGVAHTRLRAVGGYDNDTTELLHQFHQRSDAVGGDAIVVRY